MSSVASITLKPNFSTFFLNSLSSLSFLPVSAFVISGISILALKLAVVGTPAGFNFNGKIDGKISDQTKGGFGFGYDPIFIPKFYNKTLAELSTNEKNEISHRSIAVRKLINFLSN